MSLNQSFISDYMANEQVRLMIMQTIGVRDDLFIIAKERNSDGMITSQNPLA